MLRVVHPPGHAAERRYAIEVVLSEFLGLDCTVEEGPRSDVEITLAGGGGDRLVVADGLFSASEDEWLTPSVLPETPLAHWELTDEEAPERLVSRSLPVLFGARPASGSSFTAEQGGEIALGLDVFGSAFFMLTGYEELVVPARDEHERFPLTESLTHRDGFLRRPIVNEYVEVLWRALERLWPRLERRRRSFRVVPSHDVDWPLCARSSLRAAARTAAGDIGRRHDPALALRQLRAVGEAKRGEHAADPCNTFDLIMDASERRGLRSSFYFLAGRTNPARDGAYSIDDPWIRGLMRRIHERGHELGLHPSYETFRNPEQTQAELAALRRACEQEGIDQPIRGGRQHFLRWENPTTWQIWEDAGLEYDSTLGFSARPGFRAGVCFEYPVFNLRTRRVLGLRERPLVSMDRTLFDALRLSHADALADIAELRERCRLFDGDFTLLWHNSLLLSRGQRRLYESSLDPA